VANLRSSEKRNRQSLKRRARNVAVRTELKDALKAARAALSTGDAKAAELVKAATSMLARASSKGVVHGRNASRRIGRLAHALSSKAKK
jgi:small subunit ribosomal protein S20